MLKSGAAKPNDILILRQDDSNQYKRAKHRSVASPFFVPWRRSDQSRSDAQYKLHREAFLRTVDPVTVSQKRDASTQEGG